ncbi:MAG: hydrogen gas-evolving membrane-bound hydrogenase subunit E, partial [Rhodanobacter sp.]
FFGRVPAGLPRQPHEPPLWMRIPIGLLALACLLVGMLPAQVIGPALRAATGAVLGYDRPAYSLAVWHGLTTPLLMSLFAFVAGCLLYVGLRRYLPRREDTPLIGWLNGKRIFERLLVLLTLELPAWLQRFYPSRRLQPQLSLIVLTALLAGGVAITSAPLGFEPRWSSIDPGFALLWMLGAACAIGAATQAKFHRLAALILTGGAGLVLCVNFVWLSAPDLAATQLLVEVVTTILILLGLRWLPKRIVGLVAETRRSRLRRRRDVLIAVLAGASMASLAYAAMMHPVTDSISRFFLTHALSDGGGHNVVNVILVDFRGFDTLGEITVLAIVALTVFGLLRRFRPAAESINVPLQQRQQSALGLDGGADKVDHSLADYLMIPGLIIQLMSPVIVLFGLHLFLRGHDLPGGGFVAGITVSVALILLYMARGARWVESHLRVLPVRWLGAGLLLAVLTGLGSLLFDHPFLTSHFQHLEIPLLGSLPLASAVLFDLGVFSVVVGATTLMLIALAHQSLRRPRAAAPIEIEEAP